MVKDKTIYIKNIYYMLTYAFRVLKQENYEKIQGEDFDEIQDLFAKIIAMGVSQQLKQGLYREYQTRNESLTRLRGKLDLNATMRSRMQKQKSIGCEFDELTEDNKFNRILKTTMLYLVKQSSVKIEHKKELRKLLLYFDNVSVYEPSQINWGNLYYRRDNQNYEMLMNMCYFVLSAKLLTNDMGDYFLKAFSDEHMARLYEKFILEYYKKEHKELTVGADQIDWNLSDNNGQIGFLPRMQTDITLRKGKKTLIIDAKYYSKTMQKNFDKVSLHSNNVYQIFAYVKNEDKNHTGDVSGLLLYAKTDEDTVPDCQFIMDKNRIGAKTLDLGLEFSEIRKQLDEIADDWL